MARVWKQKGLAKFGLGVWVIPPADEVAAKFKAVADNIEELEPAFDEVLALLERVHASHFAKLRGRYVLSGRTKASLTEPHAYGAIRGADHNGLRFGSRIWYAHFLTKAPRDPENGQLHKEPPGKGRSAVLVFPHGAKSQVGKILMHHIMGPAS